MGICSTEEKPRKIGNENKIENDNIKESKNTTNNNIENSQKETLSKEINNNKSSIKKNFNKSGMKEDEADEKESGQSAAVHGGRLSFRRDPVRNDGDRRCAGPGSAGFRRHE